jgi:autotransporter adhesin
MALLQSRYFRGKSISPKNVNFKITTGDFINGSNQFTIADDFFVRVGQTLTYVNSQFTGTVTITNVSGTTITVDQNANSNAGSGQTIGLNTADGSYLIESASFFDTNSEFNVNDITGSNDSEYQSGEVVYSLIGAAANSSGNLLKGRFHKYIISDIVHRKRSTNEISFFIEWGEEGTQTESGDKLYAFNGQQLPIVQLTHTASLSPIFDKEVYPGFSAEPV